MTPNRNDMRQHVARRVRVTRMFLSLSLEESSASLGIPVWMLYYKENGMMHFSYQDLLDMERLYKMPWLIFFQDYLDNEKTCEPDAHAADGDAPPIDAPGKLDAIMQYLGLGAGESSAGFSQLDDAELNLGVMAYNTRESLPSARRWA
jgi:hypothetical protein